jgi:hypothetical protein
MLVRHGLEVRIPAGWEGRLFRLPGTGPTLHAANFPLPSHDGSFGAEATSAMGDDGVFIALVEYEPELAGTGLFSSQGLPAPLHARDVSARALQRRIPGRFGVQRFFTQSGRAFCLYTVIGSNPSRDALVRRANDLLADLRIDPLESSASEDG